MLYITQHIGTQQEKSVWHVGTKLPKIKARVITFQADGDELDLIIDALQGSGSVSREVRDVSFTMRKGESK